MKRESEEALGRFLKVSFVGLNVSRIVNPTVIRFRDDYKHRAARQLSFIRLA